MSEIKVNNIQSLSGTNGPEISGTVEMNSTGAMLLPRGDTAYRGGRGRGIFGGGYGASSPYPNLATLDYVQIATTGIGYDFGDLTTARTASGGTASATRGLLWAGRHPGIDSYNVIEFITISSTGNSLDFGDIQPSQGYVESFYGNAGNSSTRAIICSGNDAGGSGNDNELSYITLASKGDAQDFGDSIDNTAGTGGSGTSNQTRGVYRPASGSTDAALETVLIATLGNSTAFGDLNTGRRVYGSLSDAHGGLG